MTCSPREVAEEIPSIRQWQWAIEVLYNAQLDQGVRVLEHQVKLYERQ